MRSASPTAGTPPPRDPGEPAIADHYRPPMRWARRTAAMLALLCVTALVGTACSDDSGVDPPEPAQGTDDSTEAAEPEEDEEESTFADDFEADEDSGDEDDDDSGGSGGGSGSGSGSGDIEVPDEPTDGVPFTDPEGDYSMQVGPDWVQSEVTPVAGVEVWSIGTPEDGFAPNVNVLTQPTGGVSIEDFLEISLEGPTAVPNASASGIVEGPLGQELAVIEYATDPVAGAPSLRLLAVATMSGDDALLATFTAPDDRFDELLPDVEPYLFTLEPA
jgi:hypothetical protein